MDVKFRKMLENMIIVNRFIVDTHYFRCLNIEVRSDQYHITFHFLYYFIKRTNSCLSYFGSLMLGCLLETTNVRLTINKMSVCSFLFIIWYTNFCLLPM